MTSTFKVPTSICHMTHIDNLPSIITAGGLLSHMRIREQKIGYVDISLQSVQEKRGKAVPCAAGGTLHDYVPFYFHPKNPMQYTIKMGNVEQYQNGIKELILICLFAQSIEKAGIPFAYTDRHAVLALAEFYDSLENLSALKWPILNAKYWTDFPDGREVRQAEFLAYDTVPWELVKCVAVYDKDILQKVNNIIKISDHQPDVIVKRDWFF